MANPHRISGKAAHKNPKLSWSITITSMKLAVMDTILNLKRETSISNAISVNDMTTDSAGRLRIVSQTKLVRPQVRTNAAIGNNSISLQAITARAASWNNTISANGALLRSRMASVRLRRLAKAERIGGIGTLTLQMFVYSSINEWADQIKRRDANRGQRRLA